MEFSHLTYLFIYTPPLLKNKLDKLREVKQDKVKIGDEIRSEE